MKIGKVIFLAALLSAPSFAADLKVGEEKAKVCTACHGAGGVSTNPMWPSLAGQGQKYIEKQLRDFKSQARPSMVMAPQAGLLSDEDIVNVAAYFAAQNLPKATTQFVGNEPEELQRMAEAIYRGGDLSKNIPACSACHGPSGEGIAPAGFPSVSGQHAQYTRQQLDFFKNSAGLDDLASDAKIDKFVQRANDPNSTMRDIARKLTPKQIEALALYMQGLQSN